MEEISLPKPFIAQLDAAPVTQYRQDYRQYRIGFARGARGEVRDVTSAKAAQSAWDGLNDEELPDTIVEEVEDEDYQLFQMITSWRLHYRRFRQGYARGAEGDLDMLSSQLTKEHLILLPVSQLREVLNYNKDSSVTARKLVVQRHSGFHIHFGAGKLGLGLVVGAIVRSKVPFAILQRASSAWEPLLSAARPYVTLRINSEPICRLKIVKAGDSCPDVDIMPDADGWFVCGADPDVEAQLMQKADTFTCALGAGISAAILPLLSPLPLRPSSECPALYACENDHKAVEDLAAELKGRVTVTSCMVDRICASRSILAEKIEVSAEPHEGEIVVICPPPAAPLPAFAGTFVQIPKLKAEAKYFSQRKLLLVNGMHTTLAFITLCEKAKEIPPGSYDLITAKTATEEQAHCMWGWAVARCLLLLWEHDVNVIKNAHLVTSDDDVVCLLLAYARQTLDRFSTVEDTTGRVLSGGIVNRFQTRLKNVEEFMDAQGPNSVPLGARLLTHAGIGSCELGYIVHSLVRSARRFVELPRSEGISPGVANWQSDAKEAVEVKTPMPSRPLDVMGVSNPVRASVRAKHIRNIEVASTFRPAVVTR